MSRTAILIPARRQASRFPEKMFCSLDGKPMIRRVFDTCNQSGFDTFVVTDSRKIAFLFDSNNVVMSGDADNGTSRCASVIEDDKLKDYTRFVNVQGDMPDITIDIINKVQDHLSNYPITTAYTNMSEQQQNDPNSVKMVRAGDKALWFGRGMTGYGEWHLGVYGYRKNPLQLYNQYKPEKEEQVEKLEQIRWLKAGWDIGCVRVEFNGIEINTPEDARKWNESR